MTSRRRCWPRDKAAPDIEETFFLESERAPTGGLGEVYRLLGIVRPGEGQSMEPMEQLARLLQRSPLPSSIPYLDLARGLLNRQQYDTALDILDAVSAGFGETPRTLEWSAVALLGRAELAAAEQRLLRALELQPC